MMDTTQGLLVLVLVAVCFLTYKVIRIERRLNARDRPKTRRNDKIVPILKDRIEKGPFSVPTQKDKNDK
jgi:uncharacterized membrane protein